MSVGRQIETYRLPKLFPNVTVYRLDRKYRSSAFPRPPLPPAVTSPTPSVVYGTARLAQSRVGSHSMRREEAHVCVCSYGTMLVWAPWVSGQPRWGDGVRELSRVKICWMEVLIEGLENMERETSMKGVIIC